MRDKSVDAPRLAINVREGVRRLLVVLAIASACSIGATTWTWIVAERAERDWDSRSDAWVAAPKNSPEEAAAWELMDLSEQTWMERKARFQSFQNWTVISHLIAAATGLLLWALSGFVARQKVSLTIATAPPRQTGSADTGPPADTVG
jgi:hypothetical protein